MFTFECQLTITNDAIFILPISRHAIITTIIIIDEIIFFLPYKLK